jgi:hypothetical protein
LYFCAFVVMLNLFQYLVFVVTSTDPETSSG